MLLKSDSQVSRAKRYFEQAFLAGGIVGNQTIEEQFPMPIAVQALTELMQENTSTLASWYERAYQNMPATLQKYLAKPIDRQRVLSAAVSKVTRYGSNAAPAVPVLVRLYQSTNQLVRVLVTQALGRIGPAASNAIPALVIGLHPTNSFGLVGNSDPLVQIDPSGDYTARALASLLQHREQESWLTNLVDKWLVLLAPRNPDDRRELWPMGIDPNAGTRWAAVQALGLMRFAAPRAVPVIKYYVRDPSERMRAVAASALGRLGPEAASALPELCGLLTDEWAMVREAATNAIRRIERR
jgi:HEAT repeat protein